ncbi:hypothetical protein BDQ94DRAFT_157840 [Aspergillus welwitschiae]|uniref:3'-5' exonuclease domain-containing protein n=1 Tax=Aspergillus welwitschiae TaxID=1341132 RepID=A0A3F3QBA5_9EURO|nr:hypothetical protein BDQ94DRAFT_157840 [Aspergillus welwitschiae]RDH36377.1 hypothetical protein BDQ94DRAFT_157840 [Aspergillus welwitschiae]
MLLGLVQIRDLGAYYLLTKPIIIMSGVQEPTGAVGTDKDRGESEILVNHRVKEEHKVLARKIPSTENATSRNGIPKVFFDVRNDSVAMFHQYQVKLAGIYDLQVMEVGTRARPGKYLAGLAKCISRDAPMTPFEKAIFNSRPLSKDVVEYCVQDVQFLPRLWQTYSRALTPTLRRKVQAEVRDRTVLSQSPQFNGKGINMVLPPQISETETECPITNDKGHDVIILIVV